MRNRRWVLFSGLSFASVLVVTSCGNNLDSVKNLQAGAGRQIVILGDSIAAGYGVAESEAFPSLLSSQLGLPIVNRGVSGDTTAMGLQRLQEDAIAAEPWLVMVELAGNDFLKQVPPEQTEENLRQIIAAIQAEKAIVVLLGINVGIVGDRYKEMFERVAKETGSYLIPQVLKGILDNPQYMQSDRIHPNAAGHRVLAARVAKDLQPLLDKAQLPPALMQYK
ncbi:MAG: arylesterase [Oscillatoria sp. SIO1A7]|nr:arylesterase [Oscillatoria sp. SIO1A7]